MRFMTRFMTTAMVILASCVAVEPKTVEVEMLWLENTPRFNPREIEISVGDTVIWTNKDPVLPHTVDEGTDCSALFRERLFGSGLVPPGGTFKYKFEKAGVFPYFCFPHC
ncbi:hypothetical protein BGW41_005848, partial [Actinomortierella wolfii]